MEGLVKSLKERIEYMKATNTNKLRVSQTLSEAEEILEQISCGALYGLFQLSPPSREPRLLIGSHTKEALEEYSSRLTQKMPLCHSFGEAHKFAGMGNSCRVILGIELC